MKASIENDVHLPLKVEHFLSSMFGKESTHGIAGPHPKSFWKKYCKRLVSHLERYIEANILTDRLHWENIQYTLDSMKEAVNSNQIEVRLVQELFRMCLLLIGDMPDHWDRKKVNRPEHFPLKKYRRVYYSQSPSQKASVIFWQHTIPLQGSKIANERKKATAIMKVFLTNNSKGKKISFVRWFQKKYPKEYNELFN